MSLREIVWRRRDGVTVRSLAYYSYRDGPLGRWMIGDTPVEALDGTIIVAADGWELPEEPSGAPVVGLIEGEAAHAWAAGL